MIFNCLWIKKDRLLLDMINYSIFIFLGYCSHLGVPLVSVLVMPIAKIGIISMITK